MEATIWCEKRPGYSAYLANKTWRRKKPLCTRQEFLVCPFHFVGLASCGFSPVSKVFRSRKRPAASRILLNSIQKACTSINKSWTLIILFRIKDCRKTQTSLTKRFWKSNKEKKKKKSLNKPVRGPITLRVLAAMNSHYKSMGNSQ